MLDPLRPAPFRLRVLLCTLAAVLITGCDIPSQGPDFAFNTGVSTPVIFDQSFVFLGSAVGDTQALIDTTKSTYDSLFAVDDATGAVYLVHTLDDFDLAGLDDLIDPVAISPQDVSVTMGDLATQDVTTDFDRKIGVVEVSAVSTPYAPADVATGQVYFPLTAGDFLTIPPTSLIDLSGADVESVVVTSESGSVNSITFEIRNQSSESFTDGSGTPDVPPALILETDTGLELSRIPFDASPGPGQTAAADVSLSGRTIPSSARFRLDISTSSGFGPIGSDPNALYVRADMQPVRYDGFTLSNIPESTVDVSHSAVSLSADVDFTGITTRSGLVMLRIDNTLPVPVDLGTLYVINDDGVDAYQAGHPVFSAAPITIPPRSSVDVPVQLGRTAVSSSVSVNATATAPATSSPTFFEAGNGLDIGVAGSIDVEKLYFLPAGETFSSSGTIAIDASEITFQTGADFVEFGEGALKLRQLLNGIDLSFDEVVLSFPQVRRAPYGPADSLVIRFRGTTDKAEQLTFAAIERNEPARDLSVSLAETRAYALGNVIRYNVEARSETSGQERVIDYTDEVSTNVEAAGLTVAAVAGYIEPFSADLNEDADGDGRMDPMVNGEAIVSDLGSFGLLQDVSGLQLTGSELAISLSTSLTADLTIYGLLVGEDDSGNRTFLRGRSASAVAPGDSLVDGFSVGGAPASADQLFKIAVSTTGNDQQPSTHSLILDAANSNIDELLSSMPSSIRFVGKAVVEAPDGRVQLRQPLAMDISLGAIVPLSISDTFTLEKTLAADLSVIESLTDPDATFTAEHAAITLAYTNGIPLDMDAQLEFVDAFGSITTVLPSSGQQIRVSGAVTNEDGFAAGPSAGEIVIELDESALRSLATSRDVRLGLTFDTSTGAVSRIRAADQLDLMLRGDFDVNVSVRP